MAAKFGHTKVAALLLDRGAATEAKTDVSGKGAALLSVIAGRLI